MKNYFTVNLQIYPFDVIFSFDQSDQDMLKCVKKHVYKSDDLKPLMDMGETIKGRCVMLQSNITVIRIKTTENKAHNASIIAHEIFHAVTFILDKIGMPLGITISDEAYAYLIQYLTKKVYEKIDL